MMFAHGETVTVLRGWPLADPYSGEDSGTSWDNPAAWPIDGVGVEPRPSGEPVTDARNAVTSGFTLYLPTGADVTARDRIMVRGDTYQAEGDPAAWRNPFTGWRPGLVMQVGRVEG